MPHRKVIFYLTILCTIFTGNCGRDKAKAPFKAKIVVSTQDGYRLETVNFNTLHSMDKMSGEIAKLVGNASLNIEQDTEVLVGADPSQVYLEKGEDVQLEYTLKGGVAHPLNFDSMAMLTVYYHYEKTMEFWRDNLNLDWNDFGVRRLLFDPNMSASGIGSIQATIKLNAAFLPGVRDFWFFKTSPIEKIPFKMNLGILAHEFAHGIFDYQFAKNQAIFYNADNSKSQEQLSGINEGLADYFSWMVTGRTTEFVESLDQFADERVMPVSWKSQQLQSTTNTVCKGGFYCKGSVLASALYDIALQSEIGPILVGNTVFQALDLFRNDWSNFKETTNFDYYYILLRIVEAAENAHKKRYCNSFIEWFNDELNLGKVKEVCDSIS